MKSHLLSLFICSCCAAVAAARSPDVFVAAGVGGPEASGDSKQGAKITTGQPFGVEIGPDEALYITDIETHRVLRLDRKSNRLDTVAGSGEVGYSGDGGPATEARLNEPYEVRFDRQGNMFFVEMKNHVVRRVDAKTRVITTIAGTGKAGFGGDGGPAARAALNQPHSIALDSKGAIYIADIGNHRIRRVDPRAGKIESIAGNAERKLPTDGQRARGNPILGPRALYIRDDTLWIALREGHSVWRMSLGDGVLHHVAGTGKAGFNDSEVRARDAKFNSPKGIAVGVKGDVFVVDAGNNAVRRIDARLEAVATLIDGSAAAEAASPVELSQPHGICVDAQGTLYIGDTLHHRVLGVKP